MRQPFTALSLVASLTLTAMPAFASESFSLESRLALEPQPRLEAKALPDDKTLRELKSPGLAVALSVGTPLALSTVGTGLMALGGYPSQVNALGILGMAVTAASPLALGTGQAYAGDPQRGFWVGLGTYGALVGGTLLGLGAASLAFPEAMQAGGQSAGFGYVMVGLPIAALISGGYTIWALVDANRTAVRHNEALMSSSP